MICCKQTWTFLCNTMFCIVQCTICLVLLKRLYFLLLSSVFHLSNFCRLNTKICLITCLQKVDVDVHFSGTFLPLWMAIMLTGEGDIILYSDVPEILKNNLPPPQGKQTDLCLTELPNNQMQNWGHKKPNSYPSVQLGPMPLCHTALCLCWRTARWSRQPGLLGKLSEGNRGEQVSVGPLASSSWGCTG